MPPFPGISAQVQAATDAKIKGILLVDSADKEGFVPRRVFVSGVPHEFDEAMITVGTAFCATAWGCEVCP